MQVGQIQSTRLEIRNLLRRKNHRKEMARDILEGLSKPQKSIPSKYFYDVQGSRLFERICSTREYYPTRTELSILDRAASEIMEFFSCGNNGDLVELGSGSSTKVRKLLDAVESFDHSAIRYVPVDISESCLRDSAVELLELYPGLSVLCMLADFNRHLDVLPVGRKLITFLGGTIGNFTEQESSRLLTKIADIMNSEDRFLIGIDMLKPRKVLEAAYNDSEGVTSAFNLNILNHINRELNANFDPHHFEHVAFFNADKERVEMHLRAKTKTEIRISDLQFSVDLKKGETIRTEICWKFSKKSAARRFIQAGFSVVRWFMDARGWFSLVELKKSNRRGIRISYSHTPMGHDLGNLDGIVLKDAQDSLLYRRELVR